MNVNVLTRMALKVAGSFAFFAACTGMLAPAASSAATAVDSDFAARCGAAGVVLCTGLNSATDLQAGEIGPAGDGTQQGFIDTTQGASGAGSLKFTLRAGVSDRNVGGYWEASLPQNFKSGDTIYVQYRWRASPEYFTNNANYWQSSVKQINIHGPSSTCQGAEFTTVMQDGYPSMYTDCGIGWHTDVNTNALLSSCPDDCLLEQGSSTVAAPSGSGYNCHYQNQVAGSGNGSGCFVPPSNTWITHYEVIKLGTVGSNTSSVNAYEAHNGSAYKQWQRVNGVTFVSGGDSYFSKLRFETYMTEIARSAPSTAYIWYDELIVSTQPIAVPGNSGSAPPPAPVGPNPPTNVTVQ
jgi:hypothetical protein